MRHHKADAGKVMIRFSRVTPIACALALPLLAACELQQPAPNERSDQAIEYSTQGAPEGADPGTCWGKDITPAVIETQTDKVLERAAVLDEAGNKIEEPIYRLETRQMIVQERREVAFQTPCEADLTPDFIASLQRALSARSLYAGAAHGELDAATKRAIRAFQKTQGLDSSVISLAAARQLGLVAVAREEES